MPVSVSDDARQLLDNLARQSPEWGAWLALQEEVLREVADPAWDSVTVDMHTQRAPMSPLLDGATITVNSRVVNNWQRRLFKTAASVIAPRDSSSLDQLSISPIELMEAAISQDEGRLVEIAQANGTDPAALAAVANLAAVPLLQACQRQLEADTPSSWPHGYCPVCGALAAMAEMRGIEHARRLRCGRCGGDWPIGLVQCPYCRESHHRPLGSLQSEGAGDTRKVDTCNGCKGYIKSVTTLSAWPPYRVALEDLATVDLDMVALDRGYERPRDGGYVLSVRIVEAVPPPRRGLFDRWRS